MKIFKYEMPDAGKTKEVYLPKDAQVLSVQAQDQKIYLWAAVEESNAAELRRFRTVGTGWDLPSGSIEHLGTVQQSIFVWHVWELLS